MNTFRKILIDRLQNIGGYSTRWDRYPIEFDVGLYYATSDMEEIAQKAHKYHGMNLALYERIKGQLDFDFDWAGEQVVDDMRHMLNDCCGYTSYGPAEATKWGLPYVRFPQKYERRTKADVAYYPAAKSNWKLVSPYHDTEVEARFVLEGRGGKHLGIAEFEGVKLSGESTEGLIEDIQTWNPQDYSNAWCQKLLAMLDVWEQCFSPVAMSEEFDYQMAHHLARLVEDFQESHEFGSLTWADRQNLGVPA